MSRSTSSHPILPPSPCFGIMPWFYCDQCGDSVKKPKIASHLRSCPSSSFTCIDCSRQFDRNSVHGHTKCVTEHEKYAEGATKPGGYASKGFYLDAATAGSREEVKGEAVAGMEFLSEKAPWKCSLCKVTCTSRETLMQHASGSKHGRKAKAAVAARRNAEGEKAGDIPATSLASMPSQDGGKTDEGGGQNVEKANGPAQASHSDKENRREEEDEGKTPRGIRSISSKKSKKSERDKGKVKDINWKKIARTELKRYGGTLKRKALLKAMIEAAGMVEVDREDVLEKLRSSSKFSFDGKLVHLKGRSS